MSSQKDNADQPGPRRSPRKPKKEAPIIRRPHRKPRASQPLKRTTKITEYFKPTAEKSAKKPQHKPTKDKQPPAKKAPSTFNKYGYVLPSLEQILADSRELDEYKSKVDALDELIKNDSLLRDVPQLAKPPRKVKVLDCKKLSLDDVRDGFFQHKAALEGIFKGNIYSENDEAFKRKTRPHNTEYSPALIFFTDEQKNELMQLLGDTFPKSLTTTVEYFCRVLLPEACIRIFMDTYAMSKEEALKYMREVPLTDF